MTKCLISLIFVGMLLIQMLMAQAPSPVGTLPDNPAYVIDNSVSPPVCTSSTLSSQWVAATYPEGVARVVNTSTPGWVECKSIAGAWVAVAGGPGGSYPAITSPATSINITGSATSVVTLDLSSTYLNTYWAQLNASNTFGAGDIQTFTPSSTAPGAVIVPGSVPSAILSYAGGLFDTATGILGYGDGTNIYYIPRFFNSMGGTNVPTVPTTGHVATVTSSYGIADSGSNLTNVQNCGTTSSCSATNITSPKIAYGSAPLVSGTPSTVTVTGISPAFTSSTSYFCTLGSESGATTALFSVTNVSGSSFTIIGPSASSTVVNYQCIGN